MSTVHRDPWRASIAHLLCAEPIPCPTTWPAARTRRVLAADDDRADRATGTSPAEREVLGLLGPRSMTPAELAEALDVRAGTLYTRTSRMQAKGLIVRDGARWSAAAAELAPRPSAFTAPNA
jgi:DNA-directed RNA polymerase specialized sigma24 family protein